MINKRDYSIDIIKFIAAILITNSHLEAFDNCYRFGTGGSIGDVLFLFCSGYTLFMGRMGNFPNWYKRRLRRIFPPVISWGILSGFIFNQNISIKQLIISGGGWFVQCILIYYLLAYPIKLFLSSKLKSLGILILLGIVCWFSIMEKPEGFMIYGWNYCKWLIFFLFFLQGAYMGLHSRELKDLNYKKILLVLIIGIVCWYLILFIQQHYKLSVYLQLITIIPLLTITYSVFALVKTDIIMKLYYKKFFRTLIIGIGGLCYEIYLVQFVIFKTIKIEFPQPLNIIAICMIVWVFAYILHLFTNFLQQTINDGNYNWKLMRKIY